MNTQAVNIEGPEAILDLAENFDGRIIDLDLGVTVGRREISPTAESLRKVCSLLGIRTSCRVIVSLSNSPQFIVSLMALLSLRATPFLLHGRSKISEIMTEAARSGAAYLILDRWNPSDAQSMPIDTVSVFERSSWIAIYLIKLKGFSTENCKIPLPGVTLHSTSGSMGRSKIAVRPSDCTLADAVRYREELSICPEDSILTAGQMSHLYGYGSSVITPLLTGANILTMRKFSPSLLREAIEAHGLTIFFGVPFVYALMLSASQKVTKSRLKAFLSAGEPLPQKTAFEIQNIFTMGIRPLYGTTETGAITIGEEEDSLRTGCVGKPLRGVEIRLGNCQGNEGNTTLQIRSASVMVGYLEKEQLVQESLSEEGYFMTDDLGEFDPDGKILLRGRLGEVINNSGLKVVPFEVESEILKFPGIREVKVYAGENSVGLHIVKAAVVLRPGFELQELRSYCREHLSDYKCPQKFIVTDALPRTESGKIDVKRLA